MGKEWDKFDGGQQGRWEGRKQTGERCDRSELGGKTITDRLTARPNFGKDTRGIKCLKCGHYKFSGTPCRCKEPEWEIRTGTPPNMAAYYGWTLSWATEALRVLKPGGSLLSFGGTRTFHRLTCGLEDSGFIIKDCLMWLYGQGFPKAQDLGKMIDKRGGTATGWFGPWMREERERRGITQKELAKHFPSKTGRLTGCVANWELGFNLPTVEQFNILCDALDLPFTRLEEAEREVVGKLPYSEPANIHPALAGTHNSMERTLVDVTLPASDLARHWDGYKIGGIKPAWEPIIWAVKPPEGAWIDNVLKYGTGAVNVDECRVASSPIDQQEQLRANTPLSGRYKQTEDTAYSLGPAFKDHDPSKGRFPANLILSHTPDCREVGTKRVKGGSGWRDTDNQQGKSQFGIGNTNNKEFGKHYADPDGLETISAWECAEGGTVEAEVIELDGELFTPFDPLPDLRRAGSLLIEQLRQVRDNRNIRIGDIDNSLCYETHAPLLSKLPSYRVCCRSCRHLYDELSLLIQGFAQESPRQLSDALELVDRHLDSQEHNQKNLPRVHPSSSDDSPGDVLDLDIELNNIFDAHPCVLCEPKIPFHKSDTVSSESHETNCNTPENNKTDSSDRHKRLSDNACTDALSRLVFVLACKTSSLYIPIISHSSDIKLETCPVRLLDEQSGVSSSQRTSSIGGFGAACNVYGKGKVDYERGFSDTGGASRFFYTSKATDRQVYNDHPTLKPTDLIEWLIRLVTRPGQLVLDPFAGSGTTGVAAIQSGREFILIEQDSHYISICERRTTDGAQQGMF